MSAGSGLFTGDPARISAVCRDFSIQRHSHLQMNKRSASSHEMDVCFIQSRRFVSQQTCADFNAGLAQMRKAATGDFRIGIFYRRDETFDSDFDQSVSARRGAAMMSMRLKRNV